MTTPEHKHRWAADRTQVGQSCMDCGCSGWDWHVDEVRRLRAIVKALTARLDAIPTVGPTVLSLDEQEERVRY